MGVDIQTIQSIVGHADTEMTEHYLPVQESIRQSAIQLFIARTSERLELEGYIDVNENLIIRNGRLSEHVIRPVTGVKFSNIIKETLDIYENIDGFGTSAYGNNENGYTIVIDATVKGRN